MKITPNPELRTPLFSHETYTEEETLALGKRIAEHLKAGDVVCLEGELGAGKTTLARGILSGLGWKSMVKSPSFVLLIPYETAPPLVHADLYRLTAGDVDGIGLAEYLDGEHIVLVEWADKINKSIFEKYLDIKIKAAGETREISLSGYGARFEKFSF